MTAVPSYGTPVVPDADELIAAATAAAEVRHARPDAFVAALQRWRRTAADAGLSLAEVGEVEQWLRFVPATRAAVSDVLHRRVTGG